LRTGWLKANFHAHSNAWKGVTDGRGDASYIAEQYRDMGYDVFSLSNYQTITQIVCEDILYIPAYEHGYNAGKRHQLVLNAEQVAWFDYPLFQSAHQKQHIIDMLYADNGCVALAHPSFDIGYSERDLIKLSEYQLFEVLNHYRISDHLWDAALSSGHPVWIVGNDDTHNADNSNETGVRWTMINTAEREKEGVLQALISGRAFGVDGRSGKMDNRLEFVSVSGDTLRVLLTSAACRIEFIGQGGVIRKTVDSTRTASLVLTDEDTYVRTVIHNAESTFYLNPVIRCRDSFPRTPGVTIDYTRTWFKRFMILGMLILAAAVQLFRRFRTQPVYDPLPV
jgi:hypothetical protein